MAASLSTALKNYLLGTGDIKTALADGFIYVYSGTVPASADEALTDQTLLVKMGTFDAGSGTADSDEPDDGLDLGTAASGAITKDSDVWTGQIQAGSGTAATFFRWCGGASSPSAIDNGTSTFRIQGTCGLQGADLNFNPNSFTDGNTKTIGSAEIRFG